MKKNKIIFWLTILPVGFYYNCVNTDYDFGQAPQITMNAFLTNTEPVTIFLTESYFSSSSSDDRLVHIIENAHVILFEDGVEKIVLAYDQLGRYISNYYPLPGKKYKIIATVPGLGEVSSETTLPETITFNSFNSTLEFEYIDTLIPNPEHPNWPLIKYQDTLVYYNINLSFNELPQTGNMYRLSVRKLMSYNVGSGKLYYNKTLQQIGAKVDPKVEQFAFNNFIRFNYYIFYDSLVNNQTISIKTAIYNHDEKIEYPVKYYIYLENLSEQTIGYYNFLSDYFDANWDLSQSDSNSIYTPIKSEFVQNYIPYIFEDNIEGGYGYVCSGSGAIDSIIINERPY
jgi:hypothetical protein